MHWLLALAKLQKTLIAFHAIYPLAFDPMPSHSQSRPHAPVDIGGLVFDQSKDGLLECVVVGQGYILSAISTFRGTVLGRQVAARETKVLAHCFQCTGQCRRARNTLFCFGKVNGLLENIALQSLAAQSAFRLFDTLSGQLQLKHGNHDFFGINRHKGLSA